MKYSAFYSSQLGGVVTDPALMVIPFDDHMVHRGHGIFDTAGLVGGKIYDLEAHLDRFLGSAERSRLALYGSRERMREIIEAMPPDRCDICTTSEGWRSKMPELISRIVAMISENSRPTERARSNALNWRDSLSFSAGWTNTGASNSQASS